MNKIPVAVKSFNVRALGDIDITVTVDGETAKKNPNLINEIIKWKVDQVCVGITFDELWG